MPKIVSIENGMCIMLTGSAGSLVASKTVEIFNDYVHRVSNAKFHNKSIGRVFDCNI